MTQENKEVLSPDFYAILTNPDSKVIINDIRFINPVLLAIDSKYEEYKIALRRAISNEQQYKGLDPAIGTELYDKLLVMMEQKKETLKKDIIVSGHLSNISKKTNIRTAVVFYRNLRFTVGQQLDLAYSLIISRLKTFYTRNI